MFVLVDTRNLQLRGVFSSSKDCIIQDDKVVTPTYMIVDLNTGNSILKKYDKGIPSNWNNYPYYYDTKSDTFKRARVSDGRMVFVEE